MSLYTHDGKDADLQEGGLTAITGKWQLIPDNHQIIIGRTARNIVFCRQTTSSIISTR